MSSIKQRLDYVANPNRVQSKESLTGWGIVIIGALIVVLSLIGLIAWSRIANGGTHENVPTVPELPKDEKTRFGEIMNAFIPLALAHPPSPGWFWATDITRGQPKENGVTDVTYSPAWAYWEGEKWRGDWQPQFWYGKKEEKANG